MYEGVWGIVTIIGPIILGAAIIFAIVNNRKRSASDIRRTEAATRELYAQSDREDKAQERP